MPFIEQIKLVLKQGLEDFVIILGETIRVMNLLLRAISDVECHVIMASITIKVPNRVSILQTIILLLLELNSSNK